TSPEPASAEWTLKFSPTDFSSATIAAGPAAANKSLSCSNGAGTSTCVLWGLNSTAISNGVVAVLTLTLSGSTAQTSSSVQLTNGMSSDAAGTPLSTSASGGTVTISQTPDLSSLSCNPTAIDPSNGSNCKVTLTSAAGSG